MIAVPMRKEYVVKTYFIIAVACQLWDEAHVVFSNLDHLLTDVVLRTTAGWGAGPSVSEQQEEH